MTFFNQIYAERDSVCMGDDCNAPNAQYLDYETNKPLSEFMNDVSRMQGTS